MNARFLLPALLAAASLHAAGLHLESGPARVAVIELYTSEGCSSCPPADRWLGALRTDPGLWKDFVPMAFHVNYWDHLGWKDRLSSPELTARQYAYASALGMSQVYTPCFFRDGEEWRPLWGSPPKAGQPAGRLTVDLDGDHCRITYVPSEAATAARLVHVALLGGGLSSRVTAGENSGETLRHEFVVVGLADGALDVSSPGGPARAVVALPQARVPDLGRRALAVWVTRPGELTPVQATGGWIP